MSCVAEHNALDTSGLLCPLPVIRTQDAIKKLSQGDRLTVTATDPGTMQDIPAWVRVHGHDLIRAERNADSFEFEIAVRGD